MDIEAAESDTLDEDPSDSEDEATSAERARQAAESVPLRKRDEINSVLRIANKWEEYALEQNRRVQELVQERPPRESGKRKAPPSIATSSKRVRAKSPSPPPDTIRAVVPTAKGDRVFYLPFIPGESELERESRIYDATQPMVTLIDDEAIKELRMQQNAARTASVLQNNGPSDTSTAPAPPTASDVHPIPQNDGPSYTSTAPAPPPASDVDPVLQNNGPSYTSSAPARPTASHLNSIAQNTADAVIIIQ